MPTLLETLIRRKLEAARLEAVETFDAGLRDPQNIQVAQDLVKASPLATDWLPEVPWALIWHNVHAPFPNGQRQVLVDDGEEDYEVRMRFLVAHGGDGSDGFSVGIVDEDYDGPDWQDHVTIVASAVGIGLWMEERLAARAAAFGSVNGQVFESTTVAADGT